MAEKRQNNKKEIGENTIFNGLLFMEQIEQNMVEEQPEVTPRREGAFSRLGFLLGLFGLIFAHFPGVGVFSVLLTIPGLIFSVVALKRNELGASGLVLNALALAVMTLMSVWLIAEGEFDNIFYKMFV